MTPHLFLEAFGSLNPCTASIRVEEEDLYSVFRERSALMGWSTMDLTPRPLFWELHEAELAEVPVRGRIGWVQVGLAYSTWQTETVHPPRRSGWAPWPIRQRPVVTLAQVLPALCQCLADALHRFGDITWEGLQLTVCSLQDPRPSPDLYGHNWFNLDRQTHTAAVMAFDQTWIESLTLPSLRAGLQRQNTGLCGFGPKLTVPPPQQIAMPTEAPFLPPPGLVPARTGLTVTLPEWTASAIGWSMAFVTDTAHTLTPNIHHFALRVTRQR